MVPARLILQVAESVARGLRTQPPKTVCRICSCLAVRERPIICWEAAVWAKQYARHCAPLKGSEQDRGERVAGDVMPLTGRQSGGPGCAVLAGLVRGSLPLPCAAA